MDRAMPPRPHIHGPRKRANATPRVLLLCEDDKQGAWLHSKLRSLLAKPWFTLFQSIDLYHDSFDGDIIHDLTVYCPEPDEETAAIKRAVDRIMLFCPEARIVIYAANNAAPQDSRIIETVHQPNENALAAAIDRLLRPEAA